MDTDKPHLFEREIATLYGSHRLPLAVAAIPDRCTKPTGSFSFGIDQTNAAETIRVLADEIERGGVILQRVSHTTRAKNDDFVMHHVTLSFAAKRG